MPKRIQCKRTKGWRMPEGAVYVGRPTLWGNPFATADEFREWLEEFRRRDVLNSPSRYSGSVLDSRAVELLISLPFELRGKDLACWCPLDDEHGNRFSCHADVLLELANQ